LSWRYTSGSAIVVDKRRIVLIYAHVAQKVGEGGSHGGVFVKDGVNIGGVKIEDYAIRGILVLTY
jgi:hypothetical protein